MITRELKQPKVGMLAFAKDHNLMAQIYQVTDTGFKFEVLNGAWSGEVRNGQLNHDHQRKTDTKPPAGFEEVLSLTEDEYNSWYVYRSNGKLKHLIDIDVQVGDLVDQPTPNDPVFRTHVVVSLMGQGDTAREFHHRLKDMSLAEIEREMYQGEFIGHKTLSEPEEIPRDKVAGALRGIGNDGTFFNTSDESFPDDGSTPEPAAEILRLQMQQGWANETLELLSRRFIEEVGLSSGYVDFLKMNADIENEVAEMEANDHIEPGL